MEALVARAERQRLRTEVTQRLLEEAEGRLRHANGRNAELVKAHWPAVARIKELEREALELRRASATAARAGGESGAGVFGVEATAARQAPADAAAALLRAASGALPGGEAEALAAAAAAGALDGTEPPAEDLPALRAQFLALQGQHLALQVEAAGATSSAEIAREEVRQLQARQVSLAASAGEARDRAMDAVLERAALQARARQAEERAAALEAEGATLRADMRVARERIAKLLADATAHIEPRLFEEWVNDA